MLLTFVLSRESFLFLFFLKYKFINQQLSLFNTVVSNSFFQSKEGWISLFLEHNFSAASLEFGMDLIDEKLSKLNGCWKREFMISAVPRIQGHSSSERGSYLELELRLIGAAEDEFEADVMEAAEVTLVEFAFVEVGGTAAVEAEEGI